MDGKRSCVCGFTVWDAHRTHSLILELALSKPLCHYKMGTTHYTQAHGSL
jgi:hypothetical protein